MTKEKITREKGMRNAQGMSIVFLTVGMGLVIAWSYFSEQFWSVAFMYLGIYLMVLSLVAAVQWWYYSPYRDAPLADE